MTLGWRGSMVVLMLGAAPFCLLAGCGGGVAGQATTTRAASQPAISFAEPQRSGAELWSANCNRCHNAPSPKAFSAAEWDLIVHHMRLRANLTGREAVSIAEFLKEGN